jgi:hypothetical protein
MNANSTTFNNTHLFDWSLNYQDVYNMAYYWMGAFRRWDVNPSGKGIENQNLGYEPFYRSDEWKEVLDEAIFWYNGTKDYNIPLITSESPNVNSGILNDTIVQPILQEMTLAERKFLYGYLKGCFANNHQLFLIFVRAESAAGGGGAGSGARAVALVWRDPNAPMKNGQFVKADGSTEAPHYGKDNAQKYLKLEDGMNEESWRLNKREYPPHKTRILFYHQLD